MRFGEQPCKVYLKQTTIKLQKNKLRIVCPVLSTQSSSPVTVNQKIQYRGEDMALQLYSKWDSMIGNAGKKLMGFSCNLSCHWWQPIFFKGIQCGAINLSRVMHCTEVKRSYEWERGGGRKRVQGWVVKRKDEGGRVELLRDKQRVREQSGDIKRQMQLGWHREWQSDAKWNRPLRWRASGDSPWIAGRQNHWAGTCSRTAAAPRAPATLPPAGPGLYHRPHLPREGSASAGKSRSAGSSGTQRTTHGIATSSSASRGRAECSSTRRGGGETGSRPGVRGSQGKGGGPANSKHGRRVGSAAGPAQALQGTD